MSLSKSDVLIFCGGANNLERTTLQRPYNNHGLHQNQYHTNIILVAVPPRYDLMQCSCMNSEIKSAKESGKSISTYVSVRNG
jgi:hypothetical protein